SVSWLLAKEFTAELASAADRCAATHSLAGKAVGAMKPATVSDIDHRRVKELIQQRDAIVESIEQHLSVGRRESGVLEHELREVEADVASLREGIEQTQTELR